MMTIILPAYCHAALLKPKEKLTLTDQGPDFTFTASSPVSKSKFNE